MNDSDYPSKYDLRIIKKYDLSILGPQGLIEHLLSIWHWRDHIKWDDKINLLELHTGGWSGNEEILNVLSQTLFWCFYWQKSERGGHYYFKIKP